MSSFTRAARAIRGASKEGISSTFIPEKGAVITPAVKKLISEEGWNFKTSSSKKQEIHYTPQKKVPSSDEEDDSSYSTTSSSEEDDDNYGYYRFIAETEAVRSLFQESAVCRHCKKGELDIDFHSVLLGTTIQTRCTNCDTQCASDVQRTNMPKEAHVRLTDYAINCLFVLAMILSGDGGTEAAKLLGLLDLPRSASIDRSSFPCIEYNICAHIIALTDEFLKDNLE